MVMRLTEVGSGETKEFPVSEKRWARIEKMDDLFAGSLAGTNSGRLMR
jgi:hypothetical protein